MNLKIFIKKYTKFYNKNIIVIKTINRMNTVLSLKMNIILDLLKF